MKFLKFLPLALCTCALFGITACGDDTDDDDFDDPTTDVDGPSMEVYSPEESKEFLGNTAETVMNNFNAEEQKEVIELSGYFSEKYGDLELPANFAFQTEEEKTTKTRAHSYNPAPFMRAIGRGAKGNPSELTRAAYYYTYNINFDSYKGVYEPGEYEWNKVAESNDVIFNFTGANGVACQLKVTASANTSDADIEYKEEWEDWDWETDSTFTSSDNFAFHLRIPHEMTATLTQNGKELAITKVVSSIDVKNHTSNANASARIANIDVLGTVNGTDNLVNGNAEIMVNGKSIVTASAKMNGRDLCNVDKLMKAEEDEASAADFITSLSAVSDIQGQVQLVGNYNINNAVLEAFDSEYAHYDYETEADAERACNRGIDVLRKNGNVELHYLGSQTVQATLDYKPVSESYKGDYYSYFHYWIEPVIKFNDGSTMSFGDYFEDEDGFENVLNTWSSLADSYMRLF